jgi:predicted glycogen debranching enzyme
MDLEAKIDKEWLLTNSRGGFASGTIAGCNTRRYHGLLVGTLTPPANRILALSTCLESILLDGEEFSISSFEFNDRFSPDGFWNQTGFKRDLGVHFDYEIGPVSVRKSIYLAPDSDTVAIEYDFTSVGDGITFRLRPFAAMRNFHYMQKSSAGLSANRHHTVWSSGPARLKIASSSSADRA